MYQSKYESSSDDSVVIPPNCPSLMNTTICKSFIGSKSNSGNKAEELINKSATSDSLFYKIGGQDNFDKMFESISHYLEDGKVENECLLDKISKISEQRNSNQSFIGIVSLMKVYIKGND